MASTIDSAAASRLLNLINKNQSTIRNTQSQIASGNRIVRAGQDASGLALSEQLGAEIEALSQGVGNIEQGASFINQAEGGLSGINDLITRGRELAVQAANGTLGDSQRQTLNTEFQQVLSEIDRITGSLDFNGQNILDGSLGAGSPTQVNIQVGSGTGPENQINLNVIEDTGTAALGINGLDISTAAGAQGALTGLDTAQQTIINTRSRVGAVSERLQTSATVTRNTIVDLARAQEEIAGTDLAQAISELTNQVTRLETSIRALGVQNRQNESNVGRLLDVNT